MKEKNRTWIIVAIIIAVLLLGYWVLSSPRVEKDVNQQSKEVIEDLTICLLYTSPSPRDS